LYTRAVIEAEHASEPSGVAGSLLAELEAGGQLIDTGSFTIDSQQARAKLREYLLADPHAYVLLLVEAAVLGGANTSGSISVRSASRLPSSSSCSRRYFEIRARPRAPNATVGVRCKSSPTRATPRCGSNHA
jgi:hypothetical protein